jgi:integrase
MCRLLGFFIKLFRKIEITSQTRNPFKKQFLQIYPFHIMGIILFQGPVTGRPCTDRKSWMKTLCEDAGVKPFGLRAIRHLSASSLAESGLPSKKIRGIMRHKNLRTTERYPHQLGNLNPEVMQGLPRNKKPSGEPSSPQTA